MKPQLQGVLVKALYGRNAIYGVAEIVRSEREMLSIKQAIANYWGVLIT